MKSYNHSKRRERRLVNNSQEESYDIHTTRRQYAYNYVPYARYRCNQNQLTNTDINVVSQTYVQWGSERRYDDFL